MLHFVEYLMAACNTPVVYPELYTDEISATSDLNPVITECTYN